MPLKSNKQILKIENIYITKYDNRELRLYTYFLDDDLIIFKFQQRKSGNSEKNG